jgi:hypothetical protein
MPALLPAVCVTREVGLQAAFPKKTTIDTLVCCRPIWNARFSSHTIWEPQMQFARRAIAIAAFFICFEGTPSFAESCSQVGQQCYSIYGRYRVTLSTDFQRKQCATATRMQGAMQARIQSLYNSLHFGERAGRFLQLSSASVTGQKAKYSLRAHIVRFAPESGLKSDIAGGPFRATGL